MSNLSPEFILPQNFCANPQDAWTIPARFYTDHQAFEHEQEKVFAKSWICVAHSSELAKPNDYVTREVIGENIVLVRGRDNVLRAFYNVCPHRGHQLLSGEGKAKNVITCPYHAWAFKLDGNLAHARNCENVANFDSEKRTLLLYVWKSMPDSCLSTWIRTRAAWKNNSQVLQTKLSKPALMCMT